LFQWQVQEFIMGSLQEGIWLSGGGGQLVMDKIFAIFIDIVKICHCSEVIKITLLKNISKLLLFFH